MLVGGALIGKNLPRAARVRHDFLTAAVDHSEIERDPFRAVAILVALKQSRGLVQAVTDFLHGQRLAVLAAYADLEGIPFRLLRRRPFAGARYLSVWLAQTSLPSRLIVPEAPAVRKLSTGVCRSKVGLHPCNPASRAAMSR